MKNLIAFLILTTTSNFALACMPPQNRLTVQPSEYLFVINHSVEQFEKMGAIDLLSVVYLR